MAETTVTNESFVTKLTSSFPLELWTNVTTIIAVSGGADSTALSLALSEIAQRQTEQKGQIHIAHVNHGLREEASDIDAEFVSNLADKLGVPFHLKVARCSEATGIEESCRKSRYDFFRELAGQIGARYVLTAHTCNDQVETLLFRQFRGTSVSGLSGIPKYRYLENGVTLARPLLDFSRREVIEFLQSHGHGFRNDESNSDNQFNRNWLRNELLPMIRNRFGDRVDTALAQLAKSANEQNKLLDRFVDHWIDRSTMKNDGQVKLDLEKWEKESDSLIRYALVRIWKQEGWPQQEMTQLHWQRLADAIKTQRPTKMDLPGQVSMQTDRQTTLLQTATDCS